MTKTSKNALKCPTGNSDTVGRFRSWCFTSWQMDMKPIKTDDMKYLCYSPEICPSTKKPHYQGYVYMYEKKTLKGMKKFFEDYTTHFERCRGNPDENRTYCGGGVLH